MASALKILIPPLFFPEDKAMILQQALALPQTQMGKMCPWPDSRPCTYSWPQWSQTWRQRPCSRGRRRSGCEVSRPAAATTMRELFSGLSFYIYAGGYKRVCYNVSIVMKALFIVGPSGSGKTTLSAALTEIYRQTFGGDTVTLVSLDPANYLSEHKDIEINELITVEDVMEEYQLGPNGAILYAMDFLLENIEWLLTKLTGVMAKSKQKTNQSQLPTHLFIFDMPGQIELYINTDTVRRIVQKITKLISNQSGTSPCMLQLFDCTYMHNISQFICLCMMSLSTMINMEMPHINVLNKVDVIKSSQTKPSRGLLNQYFRLTSAAQLVQEFKREEDEGEVTNADVIAKVIDTYGQVSFMPSSIYNTDLVINLVYELERVFGTLQISLFNQKFINLTKEVDDFSMERAITHLENQFYQEQEQNLQKFSKDIEKQKEP